MACLLLDKIPRNVDEFSLYRVLSKVIHDDPGRRFGDLMNFDVVLGSWKGRPSEPMARITIPYAEYRDQLFEIPIKIKGQKTIWHKDEAPADAATVRQLILVPYRDPKALREIQVLTDTRVRVVKVQFGVLSFSPDTKIPPIFSPEWGKDCAEDCYVAFDHSENRSLRVRIGGHSDITARSIAISLSNVERLLIGHDTSPYMLFRLFNPPGFESEDQYRTTTGVAFSDRRNQRQRHAALDDQHKRVAPFTSRTLRLVLHRAEDIEGFSTLARNLKVPLDIRQAPSSGLDVSHRKFYSPDNLFHLEKWFKELGKSSWSVAFQCAALHQNALLRPDQLLSLRDGIERLISRLGTDTAASVLRHVVTLLKAAPQNPQFLHAFRRAESDHNKSARQSKLTPWKNMWSCRHVMVSPTTVSLDGPLPEKSNHIIRKYIKHQDHFLLVRFSDENRLPFRFDFEVDNTAFVHEGVGDFLRTGLMIAGRHFRFLAYSNSGLRSHTFYFVAPFDYEETVDGTPPKVSSVRLDADAIRARLGEFTDDLCCPARYAARMSQLFSATDPSVCLSEDEVFSMKDSMSPPPYNSCYTDGVGTISPSLALEIHRALLPSPFLLLSSYALVASALQIRMGGYKGMVSTDPTIPGRCMFVRGSMRKFTSSSYDVEISKAFGEPSWSHLNRPLIMLLESRGIDANIFLQLQADAIESIQRVTTDPAYCSKTLIEHSLGSSFRIAAIIQTLEKIGTDFELLITHNGFFRRAIECAVYHCLRELKHHARIPLPGCWQLVGVADEYGGLKENEIYACVQKSSEDEPHYIEGQVLISRSPTIHPGDVQLVYAIGKPKPNSGLGKAELKNCVVFPCKGARALPSCLAGGDLDGDTYDIITLPNLFPTLPSRAAQYPSAPRKTVDHPSTIDDVVDFVLEFMNSDVVGLISINHLVIADQSHPGGVLLDADCLELAKLHSKAVDYQKTGSPVGLDQIPKLKFRERPDWHAGEMRDESGSAYYPSQTAIGKLFRAVKLPDIDTLLKHKDDTHSALSDQWIWRPLNNKVQKILGQDHASHTRDDLEKIFTQFSIEFRYILCNHTISESRSAQLSEEEVFIGTINTKCAQPRRRKDMITRMRDQTTELVSSIREDLMGESGRSLEESLKDAWAAWRFSLDKGNAGLPGMKSFGWIALGLVCEFIELYDQRPRT